MAWRCSRSGTSRTAGSSSSSRRHVPTRSTRPSSTWTDRRLRPPVRRSTQYLNIRPLLPPEIIEIYPPGSLPRLLVSPRYRAISTRGRFDALYGVTDPTVQFRDTFTAQFDVADLLGEPSLGCGIGGPQPNVNWDLVVTISERLPDRRRSGGRQPVHSTSTCSSTMAASIRHRVRACAGRSTRMASSLAPELITTTSGTVSGYPDAIFGHLLGSLGTDLGNTQTIYLCANADGGTCGTGLAEFMQPVAIRMGRCDYQAQQVPRGCGDPEEQRLCAELPVVRDAVPKLQEHAGLGASTRQRPGEPDRRSRGPERRCSNTCTGTTSCRRPSSTRQGRDSELSESRPLSGRRRGPRPAHCVLCMIPPHGDACRVLDSD